MIMIMIFLVVGGCTANSNDKSNQGNQDNENDVKEDEDSNSLESPIGDSKYINYGGSVSEANDSEEYQITVNGDAEEEEYEKISFNLTDETLIVDDKIQEIKDITSVKEGDKVEVIYGKDSPMTKSIPPIVNARALVIRQEESSLGIKVSEFNKDLISKDNTLEIKINKDTSIVDLQGNILSQEEIIDKEVLVLYGPAVTLSIPGQSEARKIILL